MTAIDFNSLVLLGIAAFNAITTLMAFLAMRSAKKTEINVAIVEKATNSMKDALVLATGEAAHAAGKEEGRIAGEVKAATLAEGKLEGA